MSSTDDALRLSIESLTRAWRTGQWDELAGYFHPQVVFLAPPASPLSIGRKACVASYQDFSRQAIIHEYVSAEPHVQLIETTAITSTPFIMTYEYEQAIAREQGTDVMAWVKQEERWQVIWRMLLSSPGESQQ